MKKMLPFFLLFFISCKSPAPKTALIENKKDDLFTIAFGSCNKTDKPQNLWQSIMNNHPDLWIWLGDIVYADSNDPKEIEKEYALQNANVGYQSLKKNCPVIGIWDDHDYGQNDGGKNFEIKKESRELLFDFLEISKSAPERNREGGYYSKIYGEPGQEVKVILLDCRYFRDKLDKDKTGKKRYLINETGDVLGEEQWIWLEKELTESTAQINIIGSGIQIIAEDHRYEKWANFPQAHKRLYDLLEKTKPALPIFISGDRHIAEVSKIKLPGLPSPVFDITSSGMTHSYEAILKKGEVNKHRVGNKLSGEKNFGVFKIDWNSEPVKVLVQVRGLGDKLIFEQEIQGSK